MRLRSIFFAPYQDFSHSGIVSTLFLSEKFAELRRNAISLSHGEHSGRLGQNQNVSLDLG
jgi:hypothetical protein